MAKKKSITWSREFLKELEDAAKKNGVSITKEMASRGIKSPSYYNLMKRKYAGKLKPKGNSPQKRTYNKKPAFVDIDLSQPNKSTGRLVMIQGSVEDVTKLMGALWQ